MVKVGTPGILKWGGAAGEIEPFKFQILPKCSSSAAAGHVRPWLLQYVARLRCGIAWGNICSPDALCFISPESQPRHVNKAVPIACPQVFYGSKAAQTNKVENFTHRPCKSFSVRHGRQMLFFSTLVPSAAVIRARTNGKHADMKANVHNFTHACLSWCSGRSTWAAAAWLPCHTSHHPCGSIKVALAAFGLVSEDCFSQ